MDTLILPTLKEAIVTPFPPQSKWVISICHPPTRKNRKSFSDQSAKKTPPLNPRRQFFKNGMDAASLIALTGASSLSRARGQHPK
jgi:hypothetical protein